MTQDHSPVVWNDQAIIAAAGGNPAGVIRLLSLYRQPLPSEMAIYVMISRRKISSALRPSLLYCLLRSGGITLKQVFTLGSNPAP